MYVYDIIMAYIILYSILYALNMNMSRKANVTWILIEACFVVVLHFYSIASLKRYTDIYIFVWIYLQQH